MIISLRIFNHWRKKSGATIGASQFIPRTHEEIWRENIKRCKNTRWLFIIFMLGLLAVWLVFILLWGLSS